MKICRIKDCKKPTPRPGLNYCPDCDRIGMHRSHGPCPCGRTHTRDETERWKDK